MNQDTITRIINKQARNQGYYNDADVLRAQTNIADSIILENMPVGLPMPLFSSYLDKINYIIDCGYKVEA